MRSRERPAIALLGHGLLRDAIADALADAYVVGSEPDPAAAAVVVAADNWEAVACQHDRPWLPVRTELGHVVVGPFTVPGQPGCTRCFDARRRRARTNTNEWDAIWHQHGPALGKRTSSWLTTLAGNTVAALVAAELAVDPEASRTRNGVLYVDLRQLTVTRHGFLPDPLCPECGDPPVDAASVIGLMPRPKPNPDTYRVRNVLAELDTLTETYVDAETGLIRSLHRDTQGGLVIAGAMLPLRMTDAVEPGIGRTRSYRTSELTAILEALERHGGVEPSGKRTAVRASFADIVDHALDPRTLGVHPDDSYEAPGFPYQRFDESVECDWVWGYSFGRQAPILVPETCAYYYVRPDSPLRRPFVYEISNGCALGSCLEEAILYGILEAAERDAFLLTWYARLAVPRIDLTSASDRAIPLQAAAITAETGYQVMAFDTTMEQGIPSVWAMAVAPDDADPTRPAMVCAAGAHLSMEHAVLSALSELGPLLADFVRRFPSDADQARQMVDDPYAVRTMHDHSTVYGSRAALHRLDFLLDGDRVMSLSDATTDPAFRNDDLSADLRHVIRRHIDAGVDIVVVDQTTREHTAGDLRCVKVLAPGLVPMTFGYRNRRIDGLPRLLTVPHLLGHRDRPLRGDELNPDPHPFP